MYKIHKIENLDTLDSELNKIISDLEIDNKILNVTFSNILNSDVVIIIYISNAKLEEEAERISELHNLQIDDTDAVKELDIPVTELADEFLAENEMTNKTTRDSERFILDNKIRYWLKSKKGIDDSLLNYRHLTWNIITIIQEKKELELRKNIPKIKDELYQWCIENNLKKITKSLMRGYLEDKNEWCPSHIADILYTKVNLELSKNKP